MTSTRPGSQGFASDWSGLGIVLGSALLIGFAPIFTKLAMAAGTGPVAAAGWRLVFALVAIGPLLAIARQREGAHGLAPHGTASPGTATARPLGARPWALVLPGLVFSGDLISWHQAFELTTAANATVLGNVAVLFVAAVGYWVLGERFGWRLPAGAAIALLGVAVLIGVSFSSGPSGAFPNKGWGDLLSLVTAAFYAGYILSVKWLRAHHGALAIVAASSAVGALVCFPVAAAWGERLVPAQPAGWAYLAGLGILSHALGQGLIALSLRRLPASLVSVLLLTQPLHVAWLGALLLGERLALSDLLSMALVLVGVGLAITARRGPAAIQGESGRTEGSARSEVSGA